MPKCIHCMGTGKPIYKEDLDKNGVCYACKGTGCWEKNTPY